MKQLANMHILVLAIFLISASKGLDNKEQMYNQKLLYKATANLTCEDNHFDPLNHPELDFHWLLPSGNITATTALPQDDRYRLFNNGSSLLIIDIDKADFGVYFCIVTNHSQSSVLRVIKFGINVDGPYFGDLWERYQSNLRNGLLASVVTFVVMAMFCYNHTQFQNRYDTPNKYQPSNNTDFPLQAYSNAAFVSDLHENKDYTDKETVTDVPGEPETKF